MPSGRSRHERQREFEEIEPAERGKLVKHQQNAMTAVLRVEIFRSKPPSDLVEHQPDERLGAANVQSVGAHGVEGGAGDPVDEGCLIHR